LESAAPETARDIGIFSVAEHNARHSGTARDAVRKLRLEQLNALETRASWHAKSLVEAIIRERRSDCVPKAETWSTKAVPMSTWS
jgi:hypothetical protein